MDFLFGGVDAAGENSGTPASPYDSLSDLCTMLLIAEDMLMCPPEPIIQRVLDALKKAKKNDGDVQVMAARALALLMDKFISNLSYLSKKGKSNMAACFASLFAHLAHHTSLQFHQTTAADLTEELLKCLAFVSGADSSLQLPLPPASEQLTFCERALDESKWTSCKVLSHCLFLTRAGAIKTVQDKQRVEGLLQRHLEALAHLSVDYEWDELLRTVANGFVTLQAWCSTSTLQASAPAGEETASVQHGPKATPKEKQRKRIRTGSQHSPPVMPPQATTSASTPELLLTLCERVCVPGVADSRKELVLACAAAILTAHDVDTEVPLAQRLRLVQLLHHLLQDQAQEVADFTDPFIVRKNQSSDSVVDEGNVFRALPSLQWVVPASSWSALVLLAKLLGGEPAMTPEYLWAWRGDGDAYYWYHRQERDTLTTAFQHGQRAVKLRASHVVDLANFTHTNVRTLAVSRVHFQPIPCESRFDYTPLAAISTAAATVVKAYTDLEALRLVLRSLSFGSTPLARLARMVYLHLVCAGPPENTEATKSAFRNLIAEHAPVVLETVAQQLVSQNRAWGAVLLDAGVADAIAEDVPATKRPRAGPSAHGRLRSPGRHPVSASPSPSLLPRRTSPVVSLLRASRTNSPALAPIQLPHTNLSLPELLDVANFAEVVHYVAANAEEPLSSAAATGLVERVRQTGSAGVSKVESALAAYVLRELQRLSSEGRKEVLLDVVAADVTTPKVYICPPFAAEAEGGSGSGTVPSQPVALCKSCHPLRLFFSVNWRCNECGQHTAYGALSCRTCDYDLCHRCAETFLRRLEVSVAATAGDVLNAWRERIGALTGSTLSRQELQTTAKVILFDEAGPISAAVPATSLTRHRVHCAPALGPCLCNEYSKYAFTRAEDPPAARSSETGAEGAPTNTTLVSLLRSFGRAVASDAGVKHAIIDAVESHGTAIFLRGLHGLPSRLGEMLSALATSLPLPFKLQLCRFLTVECRRYALKHIQDEGLVLRDTVHGDVNSNGLAVKVPVRREDMATTVERLGLAYHLQPSIRTKVEYSFDGEEGTGNGPTQELYAELSQFYQRSLKWWYAKEEDEVGTNVVAFPSCSALYLREFYVLGGACARAFIDGYAMDVDMLPQAWGVIRAMPTVQDVFFDEPASAANMVRVRTHPVWHAFAELQPALVHSYEALLSSSAEELDAMQVEDDEGTLLTLDTVPAYVRGKVLAHMEVGLENLRHFALGLQSAIDLACFWVLQDEELSTVLCGGGGGGRAATDAAAKLFSEEQLRCTVMEAHGYDAGSKEVEMFVSIVGGEFGRTEQQNFVEFLTGSPRLPMNGLAGLGRKITVVKKEMDAAKERTLPSCNTCFLYFKLPPYSTREIMKERLLLAITEGRKNFSLS